MKHRRLFVRISLSGLLITAWADLAFAQSAADEANKSNNPLNLAASFNIQNYYTPSVFGASSHTNDLLLRPTIPIGPNALIGVPQIFRATVPVSTRPDPNPPKLRNGDLSARFLRHGFVGFRAGFPLL